MLSSSEVLKTLGISKVTLYKWMNSSPPKIKSRTYTIGAKKYHGFSNVEVKRVKAKMKKKLAPGIGWL